MFRLSAVGLATLLLMGSTTSGFSQPRVKTTVASYSGYVFRGVTLTNRPVIQPTVTLAIPAGRFEFTTTGWANVEAGQYNGARDLSQAAGAAGFDVTEFDWTTEGIYTAGRASIAVGTIRYLFPNPAATSPVFNPSLNTFEVYSRVGLATTLAPTLGVYYDVSKIKGAYLEGTIAHDVRLGKRNLSLGALLGWSAGQDASLDAQGTPQQTFFNFEKNGLTHVDLSGTMNLPLAGLTVSPTVHVVYGHDRFAKITAVGQENGLKVWFGGTVAWTKALQSRVGRVQASSESESDR